MSTEQARQPAGSPDGGQFASSAGAESSSLLTVAALDGTDDAADWIQPGHVLDANDVAYLRSLLTPSPAYADPELPDPDDVIQLRSLLEPEREHGQATLTADGNIHGTYATRRFNMDDMAPFPTGSPLGTAVTDVEVDYADSGALMTTFHTDNGTEVTVEIVDLDEDRGPLITIQPGGDHPVGVGYGHGTYYSNGEHAWDDEIDGAAELVPYATSLHYRALQAESAVRYAALRTAGPLIAAVASGREVQP